MENKIKAWIKLLSAPEIGNALAVKLARMLGEPTTFIYHNPNKIKDLDLISNRTRDFLLDGKSPLEWRKISDLIEEYKIGFISILDDDYPAVLKNIFDPPPFLFYRGRIKLEFLLRAIAVVGTRKPSNYGKIMSADICANLAKKGFTIVSGLAYGIDSIAHKSALEAGGKTLAVMGTGVEQIYPTQNKWLSEKIIENGALISEIIPGEKIERWNFPKRNRIISGLSLGCLVIEGNRRSGALLTAKFAVDQNRDVFALPGDVNRDQAQGPNYLIQQGAKLVLCAEDIREEYELVMDKEVAALPELARDEKKLFELIREYKSGIQFDNLIIKTGLQVSELSDLLLNLQIKSVIKKIPGNKIFPLF